MERKPSRITAKIVLPSYALSHFLREAVFDADKFALFMENSASALTSNGIRLDDSISEDALMRLRFLVVRARQYVMKEKVDRSKFEDIFGIAVANKTFQDLTIEGSIDAGGRVSASASANIGGLANVSASAAATANAAVEAPVIINVSANAAVNVYYSEQNSTSNRGSNTDFSSGTVNDSHTDHYQTTDFSGGSGNRFARPEDRFVRAPLVDAMTLGTLIAKMDTRLKELGSF